MNIRGENLHLGINIRGENLHPSINIRGENLHSTLKFFEKDGKIEKKEC